MGKYYCCMPQCSNYKGIIGRFGLPVTLHKLPKADPVRRRAWIMAVSRKNWTPTNYTRVCSDHFKDVKGPDYLNPLNPTEYLAQKLNHGYAEQKRARKPPRSRNTATEDTAMYTGTTDGLTAPHTCTQPTAAIIRPQASDDVVPVFVDRSHSYSKMVENGETDVDGTHRPTDTYVDLSCQTDSARVQHEHHMTCLPDITIEDICDSAEMIQFYTGLPNRETLYGLFDTLTEFGIEGDDSCYRTQT